MSKENDPAPSPLDPDRMFKSLVDVQNSGLGSLAWLGTKWMETMGDLGAEWLSFVSERVKEDVKTQHQLMHAKTFNDMQQIQAQFLQKAMDDYHDETGKIVEFCSKAMEEIELKAAAASVKAKGSGT